MKDIARAPHSASQFLHHVVSVPDWLIENDALKDMISRRCSLQARSASRFHLRHYRPGCHNGVLKRLQFLDNEAYRLGIAPCGVNQSEYRIGDCMIG